MEKKMENSMERGLIIGLSIQTILHWALKTVNITCVCLFGSLGLTLNARLTPHLISRSLRIARFNNVGRGLAVWFRRFRREIEHVFLVGKLNFTLGTQWWDALSPRFNVMNEDNVLHYSKSLCHEPET